MNNSRVHAGPVCGLCEELFVDAVLQAVWNAPWRRKTASLQENPESLITAHQACGAAIKEQGFHSTDEKGQTPSALKSFDKRQLCGDVPVIARRISRAASSRISMEACSLYHAAWGVQIRLGASLRGPWLKLKSYSLNERLRLLYSCQCTDKVSNEFMN